MAFFSRPSSSSSAIRIVNPAHQDEQVKQQPRKDAVQRQCRNVMIYGSCKFQDKGCIYYHPPTQDVGQPAPVSETPASPALPAKAVNAPVFVPRAAPSTDSTNLASPLPPISPQSAVTSPSPPPSGHQEYDTHDSYDYHVPNDKTQGLDPGYYDVHADSHQLYVSEYDPNPLDSFYPSQPTFTRQPLNYHLYTLPIPPAFSRNHFLSDNLREELQARSEIVHTGPAPGLNLPDELQGYHTIVPLENVGGERRQFFNWYSTIYRATRSKDGMVYVLRRIENYRLMHQSAFTAIETWSRIRQPNIVFVKEAFTTRAFGDNSLVVVYAYHPNAQTLYDAHIKSKPPTFHHGRLQSQANAIPESVIWSYVIQICNAIKAVHDAGQAVRMIDLTKIILSGKDRIRIGSCGIIDVLMYDTRQDISLLQQEDLSMFGRLIFDLCSNNTTAITSLQETLESVSRQYSADLLNLVHLLLSDRGHKSIVQVFDTISSRLPAEMDEAQNAIDRLEGELMSELENGRIVRLLCKLGFINERPEFAREPRWSETGDRYIIKLFRDFVFHQVDENGSPVINLSHVLTCLNKLDVGTDERIMLVSRDEQNCLVVSYKEIKLCIEAAFGDLTRGNSMPP